MVNMVWQRDSWQSKQHFQRITYPCREQFDAVFAKLESLPPLVTPDEILLLKKQLQEVAHGKRFIFQGGDCAETFANGEASYIKNQLLLLLQAKTQLQTKFAKPVTILGRIAGQYTKPRSDEWDVRGGEKLLSYRGDMVHGYEFTPQARCPDPWRMTQAYHASAQTLNYCRALLSERSEDLHAFFTSHEALHLHYEQALTSELDGAWFNVSTHFPWLGKRSSFLDSAHVEYLRGIANPIGIKVSSDISVEDLRLLLRYLNPNNDVGKMVLIARFGLQEVESELPRYIRALQQSGQSVIWCCDPMHGNTYFLPSGMKTRNVTDILQEVNVSFEVHHKMHSYLGGLHMEVTAEAVHECVVDGLDVEQDNDNYKSLVDPRLNAHQLGLVLNGLATTSKRDYPYTVGT